MYKNSFEMFDYSASSSQVNKNFEMTIIQLKFEQKTTTKKCKHEQKGEENLHDSTEKSTDDS